jgi:hypothetical protein
VLVLLRPLESSEFFVLYCCRRFFLGTNKHLIVSFFIFWTRLTICCSAPFFRDWFDCCTQQLLASFFFAFLETDRHKKSKTESIIIWSSRNFFCLLVSFLLLSIVKPFCFVASPVFLYWYYSSTRE